MEKKIVRKNYLIDADTGEEIAEATSAQIEYARTVAQHEGIFLIDEDGDPMCGAPNYSTPLRAVYVEGDLIP